MSERAIPFYQGSDWLTYRWSVAQLFDTLDRMREICSHSAHKVSLSVGMQGTAYPRYEIPEDEFVTVVLGYLIELCDDLSGELDAVLADLMPAIQTSLVQRWMGFEMQLHLRAIRQQTLYEQDVHEPSVAVIDTIVALTTRMRDLLKKIDQ